MCGTGSNENGVPGTSNAAVFGSGGFGRQKNTMTGGVRVLRTNRARCVAKQSSISVIDVSIFLQLVVIITILSGLPHELRE